MSVASDGPADMATALELLLLLAAVGATGGGAAARTPSSLTYEDLAIKDGNGRVVATFFPELASGARLSPSRSCKTDGDGVDVLECRTWPDGRSLRLVESRVCITASLSTNTDSPDVALAVSYKLGDAHWYGGGEEIPQKWPLETYDNLAHAMVTQAAANRAIQDPFWFNSDGLYVYVHPGAPLFVEINGKNSKGELYLRSQLQAPYRPRKDGFEMTITICKTDNAKDAFMLAVEKHLGKPTGYPDERMIKYPVWSTWARYKQNINDVIVREFARQIKEHGFENSQLEIDDNWESCYGTKAVDKKRFPDMKGLTDHLKVEGFRVTIWTHPFINNDCKDIVSEARSKGFLMKDLKGSTRTQWWRGGDSNIVDFTNPAAREWFFERHEALAKEAGIDGFKFDAGETSWFPQMPNLTIEPSRTEDYPSLVTKQYVEMCSEFNNLTEVRSAYRTQHLPIFVRMVDKDSHWGDDNGLKSLVTTLLQMNIVGYSMVLPDMIGGNAYNWESPSRELFIRWLQANAFMPSLQYALVPWDLPGSESVKNETIRICKEFNDMHAKYSDIIIKAMKRKILDGTPVNPPIWWVDPTDKDALMESTSFLLGEEILAAPILEEGAAERDVYLPKGHWRDGNSHEVYRGPLNIRKYPAPLDVLPYFVRVGSDADKIFQSSRPLVESKSVLLL